MEFVLVQVMDVQLTFTDEIVDTDKFIWKKMSRTVILTSVICGNGWNHLNNFQKFKFNQMA